MVKRRAKPARSPANRLRVRHFLAAIVVAALVAGGLVGWQWMLSTDFGPRITQLSVTGAFRHVQPNAIRAAAKPYARGGFFRVDPAVVRKVVVALPWVADASVHLEWPSTLKIELREERPVARWGGDHLINAQGVAFATAPAARWPNLPRLVGPRDSAQRVLAKWAAMRGRLSDAGLALKKLELDARGAWRAVLNSGLELRLGREHAAENLRRFVELVPAILKGRLAEAAYIDLRYGNGFAVGWKPDSDLHSKGAGNA